MIVKKTGPSVVGGPETRGHSGPNRVSFLAATARTLSFHTANIICRICSNGDIEWPRAISPGYRKHGTFNYVAYNLYRVRFDGQICMRS